MEKNRAKMTQGEVQKTLLNLTLPMILGLLSVILFNVVDTFYISLLGYKELAAISFTFPVVFSVMSISIGLSVGASAIISQTIGKQDWVGARRMTLHSLVIAFSIVVSISLLGLLISDPLFRLLGAQVDTLPLIDSYMQVWFLTTGLIVTPMVGNGAIRATGDTLTPSIVMCIAGVCNMILDPLLIFGVGPFPRLEMQGAAIATALSYLITVSWSLWVLIKREKLVHLSKDCLLGMKSSFVKILFIAGPVAASNVLLPISNGILTRLAANFGEQAVAAFGVSTRIEALSLIGIFAIAAVFTPFVGQNFGAKLPSRIEKAFRYGFRFVFKWAFVVAIILFAFSNTIAQIFSDQLQVIAGIESYCWFVPLTYGFLGILELSVSGFNGLGKPQWAFLLVVIRHLVLSLPLAFFASQYWSIDGIFYGKALANIVVGFLSYHLICHHFLDSQK